MEFIVIAMTNTSEFCETEEVITSVDHVQLHELEKVILELSRQIDMPHDWIEVHLYGTEQRKDK